MQKLHWRSVVDTLQFTIQQRCKRRKRTTATSAEVVEQRVMLDGSTGYDPYTGYPYGGGTTGGGTTGGGTTGGGTTGGGTTGGGTTGTPGPGIVVMNPLTNSNDYQIISFPYYSASSNFSVVQSGSLPVVVMQSPGMPPQNSRQGIWEYIGMGDVNGDGLTDVVAKTSGKATASPSPLNGQWWVGINTGTVGNDHYTFSLWDGNVPINGTVDGGTHLLTWGDHQVADFNGDGKADVLARVRETGEWYLWTTNSTGTGFTTETTGLTTKSSLWGTWSNTDPVTGDHYQWRDALVGDFNGDGIADLAGRQITNATGSGAVDRWFVGLGTTATSNRGATHTPGYAADPAWWHITDWEHDTTLADDDTTWANAVVGDFNGDGRTDIAGRMVWPTNADGSRDGEWRLAVTPPTVGLTVSTNSWVAWDHAVAGGSQYHWTDVQTGDFDGDTHDDILARNKSGEWYLLDGQTSTMSLVGSWGTSYGVTVAADFDGDGDIDLAARKAGTNNWQLSKFTAGAGANTLPVPTDAAGTQALNTNIRKDYFVEPASQGYLGSSLPLALLQDLSRFNPNPYLGEADSEYIVGRYNANGSLDWEGLGGGATINNYLASYHLDFNGDNLPDILTQSSSGQFQAAENYGNSFVTSASNLFWMPSENRIVLVGDFNGDGKDDLVTQVATSSLTATWYLHTSLGDGNFSTSVFHTRSYTTTGEHVWLTGGYVGDFDGDGQDEVEQWHKLNDNPNDRTWVGEVVNASGSSVNQWSVVEDSVIYTYRQWGIGDFDGNGVMDIWGMATHTLIVGPPMLTEQHAQIWLGTGSGVAATYMLPEANYTGIMIDSRGSRAGRFDSSADNEDDITLELYNQNNSMTPHTLRVITNGLTYDREDTAGRSGGEQYSLVGDMDHDGSDDYIWIGTTPTHNIDLFVRWAIETIPSWNTGEVITGNGVPSYIWTTSSRLRKLKP